MSPTQDNNPEEERLEEFRFLFRDLHPASAIHPPQSILADYVRGIRQKGIEPQGWQSHAISAHIALCPSCQFQVDRLRRKARVGQIWTRATRWRPAYLYVGVALFISAMVALILWPPDVGPPVSGPGDVTDSSGLAQVQLRCESLLGPDAQGPAAKICDAQLISDTESSRVRTVHLR